MNPLRRKNPRSPLLQPAGRFPLRRNRLTSHSKMGSHQIPGLQIIRFGYLHPTSPRLGAGERPGAPFSPGSTDDRRRAGIDLQRYMSSEASLLALMQNDRRVLCQRTRQAEDDDRDPKTSRALPALTTGHRTLISYKGKTQGVAAWARELGLYRSTERERLARGLSVEEALTPSKYPTGLRRLDEIQNLFRVLKPMTGADLQTERDGVGDRGRVFFGRLGCCLVMDGCAT
jgi:hypothetical protein